MNIFFDFLILTRKGVIMKMYLYRYLYPHQLFSICSAGLKFTKVLSNSGFAKRYVVIVGSISTILYVQRYQGLQLKDLKIYLNPNSNAVAIDKTSQTVSYPIRMSVTSQIVENLNINILKWFGLLF